MKVPSIFLISWNAQVFLSAFIKLELGQKYVLLLFITSREVCVFFNTGTDIHRGRIISKSCEIKDWRTPVCICVCVCSLTVSWSILVVYVVDEEGEKVEGQTHLSEKLFSKFNKQFLISTNLPVFLHHNLETISLRKIDMLCPEIQFWRMISAGLSMNLRSVRSTGFMMCNS